MAKPRLSKAQLLTLQHLQRGHLLRWGAPPSLIDEKGAYLSRVPYQTAITLRQRDMIEKDSATGAYVLTQEGRGVLATLAALERNEVKHDGHR